MKKVWLLGLCLFALLVASCTQKLPVPQTQDEGLLVVFTEGKRECCDYIFRYEFVFGEDDDSVKIKIYNGKNFVAKPMSSGKYLVTKYGIYGVSTSRSVATDGSRRLYDIEKPFTIEIKPGVITYFPLQVLSTVKKASGGSTQYVDFVGVDEEMVSNYIPILKKTENIHKWQLPN